MTFAYDSKPVLHDVGLEVHAGEIVALVGVSGGGKTTLVNLIPRFYEVEHGKITVDGTDIKDVTLVSLRRQIAIVTQQTILFNDTVYSNIAYGDISKSRQDVEDAASGGLCLRLHPPASGRLRHDYRRAGRPAVGRAAPAHRHCKGAAQGRTHPHT